ncbi:MAG: anti-sigma factor domain-containing protein [Clostridia bacterium]|nr:anti-sigma factor domain-containing protein [Clostridia bacterium]
MKAVVVDVQGKYAVVLNKNGDFIKIKNGKQYRVGYEIDVPAKNPVNIYSFTRMVSIAAVIVLFLGIGLGTYAYFTPYSYINIDINPSIEITTNIFDRILSAKALNKDGDKIISRDKYRNLKIEDGIENILESAVENGYLKNVPGEDGISVKDLTNAVMFTVSSKNEKKIAAIKENLQKAAVKELEKERIQSEVIFENVSIDKHDKAADLGISPGKILLIERLQKVAPEVKAEEYKDAPVRDIMNAIKTGKQKKDKKDDSGKAKSSPGNKPGNIQDPTVETSNPDDSAVMEKGKTKNVKPEKGNKGNESSNMENKLDRNNKTDKTGNGNDKPKADKAGEAFPEKKDKKIGKQSSGINNKSESNPLNPGKGKESSGKSDKDKNYKEQGKAPNSPGEKDTTDSISDPQDELNNDGKGEAENSSGNENSNKNADKGNDGNNSDSGHKSKKN